MAPQTTLFVLGVVGILSLPLATSQCLTDNDAASRISEKTRQELLQSQLLFSADLLQALGGGETTSNVFFSPSSIYNALLMAYFVSANQTEDSLKKFLRLPEDQEKPDTFGAYSLEKYYQKLRSIKGALNYQLSSANRMYVSDEVKVRPCLKKSFRDELEAADFHRNVPATIGKINAWVSAQTRNNIKDLLSNESLNSQTNLVLVNAAYFRGLWKYQFSPDETNDVDFTLANGTKIPTKMMSLDNKFSHRLEENLDAEILELPYLGDDISMFIMLPLSPSATAVSDLINRTDAEVLRNIVNTSATLADVSIVIPKFTVDQSLDLTQTLEMMGVGDLFQGTADLSSLSDSANLNLDTIIHKSKIKVDETGTEAAAATAIFANRFAADSFIASHPFVYFIFDKKSNILLFAGVFNSPET